MQDKMAIISMKGIFSALVAGIAAIFGQWDKIMTALVVMMATDYVTGVTAAAIEHRLDSATGLKGIAKKLLIFLLVTAAAVMDTLTGLPNHALRATAALFYIGNEGISILENLGRAGVPIPASLASLFQRLKEENSEKKEP